MSTLWCVGDCRQGPRPRLTLSAAAAAATFAPTRARKAPALLNAEGVSLEALHSALLTRGDPGLNIRVATERLRSTGYRKYGRRAAAVFATKLSEVDAKALTASWRAPDNLRFALDPEQASVISPVVERSAPTGLATGRCCADRRLSSCRVGPSGGIYRHSRLDQRVRMLFDEDRQRVYFPSIGPELAPRVVARRRARPNRNARPQSPSSYAWGEVPRLLPSNPASPSRQRGTRSPTTGFTLVTRRVGSVMVETN